MPAPLHQGALQDGSPPSSRSRPGHLLPAAVPPTQGAGVVWAQAAGRPPSRVGSVVVHPPTASRTVCTSSCPLLASRPFECLSRTVAALRRWGPGCWGSQQHKSLDFCPGFCTKAIPLPRPLGALWQLQSEWKTGEAESLVLQAAVGRPAGERRGSWAQGSPRKVSTLVRKWRGQGVSMKPFSGSSGMGRVALSGLHLGWQRPEQQRGEPVGCRGSTGGVNMSRPFSTSMS
ncbi:uncharacterized protein LOC123522308 [Echinops telfairi]|uniref:Uncharacterized protein LOC123522308 n=1 Tax=Echinops telfairi TaxID=9371 RepID=A0AC55DI76_ECHTE|nr:uncharacterized protein LOC123522308 [Echinops telfairi]